MTAVKLQKGKRSSCIVLQIRWPSLWVVNLLFDAVVKSVTSFSTAFEKKRSVSFLTALMVAIVKSMVLPDFLTGNGSQICYWYVRRAKIFFNTQIYPILFRKLMGTRQELGHLASRISMLNPCSRCGQKKISSSPCHMQDYPRTEESTLFPRSFIQKERQRSFAPGTWLLPWTQYNQQPSLFCVSLHGSFHWQSVNHDHRINVFHHHAPLQGWPLR